MAQKPCSAFFGRFRAPTRGRPFLFVKGAVVRVFVWEARKQAGLTLQQLEHKTGISRSTLNRIENGQIVPRLDQLEAIAAATNTRITALFDSPYK